MLSSIFRNSITIPIDPTNPNSIPFDIETIPYGHGLPSFGEGFDPFNGEFMPFDGALHFEDGLFSFPEFDTPQGIVPSHILTLSCTNDEDSSFQMSITIPIAVAGEIRDELPDNVVESLENAGYSCEITTGPFGSSVDGENF